MRVSVITVCYNAEKTIHAAMESVLRQKNVDVEYIVIDGKSKDRTVEEIKVFEKKALAGQSGDNLRFKWISESDKGMYDALNKGLAMATGDIVGILNSDDILASDMTLSEIASAFSADVDAVYADVRFISGDGCAAFGVDALRTRPVRRYYSARHWKPWMHNWGYMPPHPSVYIRRDLFKINGVYKTGYKISADFELMVRYFCKAGIRTRYVPVCVVVMRTGGLSTGGWRSNYRLNCENVKANRENGYFCFFAMMLPKYAFKIWEFVFAKSLGRSAS